MDVNNNYKRFQGYQNPNLENGRNFKKDYVEQNYKVENGLLSEKRELGRKNELGQKTDMSNQNNAFLKKASRLGNNIPNNFFRK